MISYSSCAPFGFATAAAASPETTHVTPTERLMPLEVTVNGAKYGAWTLLERDGTLYALAEALDEWRLSRKQGKQDMPAIRYREQTWYSLAAIPGFNSRIDNANQSVDLQFSPELFAATRLQNELEKRPVVSDVEPALFLNFDFNLTQTAATGADIRRELGSLAEVGFSHSMGVITSSFIGRNLNNAPSQPRTIRRLETTYTHDFPASNITFRAGDNATREGMSGRSIYYAGLKLSRNFALQPGFVSRPIPLITGISSAPSTVELYVNDVLRQTSKVPAGPFAIDNFPTVTGAGQARVVVRDTLGRETLIAQPFFSHASLLEEGLDDWSVELGAVRRNLGTENADYGEHFASGVMRLGLSKTLTLETSAVLGRETQGIGMGASYVLPFEVIGQAALAVSHSPSATGYEWHIGLERESIRHGFTFHADGASRDSRQLGRDADVLPNRLELSASYSYTSENRGAVGVGLARIVSYDRGTFSTVSANYSVRIGDRGALAATASRTTSRTASSSGGGAASGTALGLTLTLPLEKQITSSSTVTRRNGRSDAYTSVNKGVSQQSGLGWRALAGTRNTRPYGEAGMYMQGDRLQLTADTSLSESQKNLRLGAQGAVVFMDGRLFQARYLQDSFALVDVPGYADVGVGFQGNTLTRTDARGQTLLPRLMAYQPNAIRLDPGELPISAELDTIEQITVPPWRSGVKVTFPVRAGRGALLRIVLDDGEPAPAGAALELVGDKQTFFVARRGEAFVTGMQAGNTLRLKWNDTMCTFKVLLPPGTPDDIARVGPLTCAGIKR